jgi:hypothetical protein
VTLAAMAADGSITAEVGATQWSTVAGKKQENDKSVAPPSCKEATSPVGDCFPDLMCMTVFVGQQDSLCCPVLPSLCSVLRQVLDDREDRVCLCLNQLLQGEDLLILVVEVLHHCFDVCVRLHGRGIGLIRLQF